MKKNEPPTPWNPEVAESGSPKLPPDFTERVAGRAGSETSYIDVIVLIITGFSTMVLTLLQIKKKRV